MSRIAVLTDSSSIRTELAREYGISIIPLTICWGDEAYLEGETIDASTFYRQLKERKDLPTTSQPSMGEFMVKFRAVAREFDTDTILGVIVSSRISGTFLSAQQAKAELPDLNIELVDAGFISMGTGFQAMVAARMAREGAPMGDILARLKRVRESMEIFCAMETLEYLHRGGRIGGAARFMGALLNLKPILTMANGQIEAFEKIRTRKKSLQRIVEVVEERLAGRRPIELAVVQAAAEQADIDYLTGMLKERLDPQQLLIEEFMPVIGIHSGPGTLGVVYYTDDGL